MQDDQLPEELQEPSAELFPTNEDKDLATATQVEPEKESTRESRLFLILGSLSRLGIADSVLRIGTHMLFIALALLVVWVMQAYYLRAPETEPPNKQLRQQSYLPQHPRTFYRISRHYILTKLFMRLVSRAWLKCTQPSLLDPGQK